jgi:FkbM family methyltransferase
VGFISKIASLLSDRSRTPRTAPIDKNLIFDIGLNTGQDAEFYLKKGFRVVAVEANPAIAEKAQERLAHFGPQLRIVKRGIGPNDGVLPFYVSRRHHEQSTFLKEYTEGWDLGYDEIQVPVGSVIPIIAEFGTPYYMKIDIEAWDMVVLSQLKETDYRPTFISVETGPTTDWVDALEGLGYTGFKLVNQSKNPEMTPPKPAKEGQYTQHVFEWGTSGLFGDEIPGEWRTSDVVRRQWRAHIDAGFPEGLWFDIHARWPK